MKKNRTKKGRSCESLDKSTRTRRRREKSLSLDKEGKVKDRSNSRDSSVSSIGREVRCACQYYGSDNLIPERVSLFGSRPSSRNSDMAQAQGDHEYEPINPPPPSSQDAREKGLEVGMVKAGSDSSIPEHERHFLRIPLDAELVVTAENDEEIQDKKEDMEVERMTAEELQEEIENRYLSTTPTTTETQSRTDCDVNTSMLDSSGLEDLPLKRGSRDRKTLQTKSEQMRAHAQGLQNKIRSQAGKLKMKLRNIPRPSFNMKERTKSAETAEKPKNERSRFRLPERPKFTLPERPKFTLPERPKFNFPDRPKFNLPERPKFNLPERPKFNFPNKPKINLPSFTKTRPLREHQVSNLSNAGSRKNLFDFDFKGYPKIFNKKTKKGGYATSSPKQTRGCTPPPRMASGEPVIPERKKGPVGQRWVHRFDDIKYADEENQNGTLEQKEKDVDSRISNRSESLSDFRDKDFGYSEELEEIRLPPGRTTISTKSSMSHLSEREVQSSGSSEDRHRKGVLEEIDSDEFFLRQKGISQDNVNMERYLSEEIREAFRSPPVNALAQMDYDYDLEENNQKARYENIEDIVDEPIKPTRTRSLRKKSTTSKQSEEFNEEDRFKTYPPSRPHRKSRSQSKTTLNDEPGQIISTEQPRYENTEEITQRYENEVEEKYRYENEEETPSEYYKTPGPAEEFHHYQTPKSGAPVVQPVPMKRKHSSKDRESKDKQENGWVEVEIETSVEEIEEKKPPQPTKRRRSRKDLESKVEEVEQPVVQGESTATPMEPDYIIPAAQDEEFQIPPIPPKRTRSASRGSRSLHSLALEDDKTEKPEADVSSGVIEVQRVEVEVHQQQENLEKSHEYELDEMSVGYATVEKTTSDAPERPKRPKPPRPPPPRKKRGSSSPTFNTLPHRFPRMHAPVRPVRNYSTLGPSRPPRHKIPVSTTSAEHIYADDGQSQAYVEVDDSLKPLQREDLHGSNKDLQTEEVIEKMKVRPLPPPPRPPRHKVKGGADEAVADEGTDLTEGQISVELLKGEPNFEYEKYNGEDIVEEVSIAIQTDPVPDDFCDEFEDLEQVIQEISHDEIKRHEQYLKELIQQEAELQREDVNSEEQREKEKLEQERRKAEERKIAEELIKKGEEIKRAEHLKQEERRRQEEERRQQEKKAQEEERVRLEEEQKRQVEERRRRDEEKRFHEEERRRQEEEEKRHRQEEEIRKQEEVKRQQAEEENKKKSKMADQSLLEVADVDMGYASLDRRHRKTEIEEASVSQQQISHQEVAPPVPAEIPVPVYIPVIPDGNTKVEVLKTDKLEVKELDVGKLSVGELQANNIQANDIQGNNLNVGNLNSNTGNLVLGNIELPPNFIEQLMARIPWDEIRVPPSTIPQAPVPVPTNVDILQEFAPPIPPPPSMRPPRRHHRHSIEESEEEIPHASRRSHRRHHRQHGYSSDEEEEREGLHVISAPRRHVRQASEPSITDLSKQLAKACTTAGLRAMRNFSNYVTPQQDEEKRRYIQTLLCIILVLIAGFLLLGTGGSEPVHHHHWDFQFPPQPPPQ